MHYFIHRHFHVPLRAQGSYKETSDLAYHLVERCLTGTFCNTHRTAMAIESVRHMDHRNDSDVVLGIASFIHGRALPLEEAPEKKRTRG